MALSDMSGFFLFWRSTQHYQTSGPRWEQLYQRWIFRNTSSPTNSWTMKSICPMAGSLRDFVSLKSWGKETNNPLDANSENLKNAIDSTLNGACIAALGASKFWGASSSYGSEELICLLPWGWKGLATRVLGRSWKLIVFEVDVLHGQGLDVEDQHQTTQFS